jgi:hypothetical protein
VEDITTSSLHESKVGFACVGRTLLSAAFDFDLALARVRETPAPPPMIDVASDFRPDHSITSWSATQRYFPICITVYNSGPRSGNRWPHSRLRKN